MANKKIEFSEDFTKELAREIYMANGDEWDLIRALTKFYGLSGIDHNRMDISQQRLHMNICDTVGSTYSEMRKTIKKKDIKPDKQKVDLILQNLTEPIVYKSLAVDERARFNKYSIIENECLDIMQDLLQHYHSKIGEDETQDKFLASLANSFIRNTHDARKELLKKYALDKIDDKTNTVKIEFFETFREEK